MKKIRYTLAALTLSLSGNALAQNANSAYFMDGYAYGHQLNPAKDYDQKGYFSLPFLPSNFNVGVRGNLNLQSILYPNPDPNGKKLVTYLHPSISPKEALSNFRTNNILMSDMRWDILSFGFHTKHSYNTFTLGVRTNLGVNVPYGLFALTKELKNQNYNISDFGMTAKAWGEVGWGYSRNVTDYLRIGLKLKALVGAGYLKASMDDLTLNLEDKNKWTATAHAKVEVGVTGFTWGEPKREEYSEEYLKRHPESPRTYECVDFDNVDVENPGIGGFGGAVDLGAELDFGKMNLVPGLKASVAVLDLGFIKWNNVAVAQNKGTELEFNGFHDVKIDDGDGTDMDDQLDDLKERISDLYAIQVQNKKKNQSNGLGTTLNVGVEYTLPVYKKLAFGLLSTTRFQGEYTWNEERISANFHPAKMFEMGVNFGFGTLGTSFGWIINLHPCGFNLFLAGDHMTGKLSKQYVPLKSNANIAMGINFPIGKTNYQRK